MEAAQNAGVSGAGSATIWSEVSEDEFRLALVNLERRTNAVPCDVQVFELDNLPAASSQSANQLPISVEQQFANDFAYIAAVNEGAQSVAAVCLEQHVRPRPALVLRIAAADAIEPSMKHALQSICSNLQQSAEPGDQAVCQEEVFSKILNLHAARILGRLRSVKWHKPKYLSASHKKPLWQDFVNLVHRVQHAYPARKQKEKRKAVETLLKALANHYEAFEHVNGDSGVQLSALVKYTYEVCQNHDVQDFYRLLCRSGATAQIGAALKCMHQLEKIGAYYRISRNLVHTANQFSLIFQNIQLQYLAPFTAFPTTIAYEEWATTCHVHAEVQLIIDFDGRYSESPDEECESLVHRPRIIGTSKYFCYLCFLFVKLHRHFFAANTHGRLYDQWTVPDLSEYKTDTRLSYARIIAEMTRLVQHEAAKPLTWRPEPMTSRQNLLLAE